MKRRQRISLLGATGSIGRSTLAILDHYADRFELVNAAAGRRWEEMAEIVKKYQLKKVALWDAEGAEKLRRATGAEVVSGLEGLVELTTAPDVDVVVNGLVGSVGCLPTLRAIEADKRIALANKETLVMAGEVVSEALRSHPQAKLLPVDSEHSAIFQCLQERPGVEVEKLLITASGGPFRELSGDRFSEITPEQALKHPTWSMGPKITIDSATMMNKGLEIIEAHFLFGMPYDKIDVVVHPKSIVHSFVQFRDGSLMAQLGAPDMRLPIQYALTYPERWELPMERVDLTAVGKLEFFAPRFDSFPSLRLAYAAGRRGGTAPAILNAANEVAVPAFLARKIDFPGITRTIETVLEKMSVVDQPSLEQVIEADRESRRWAEELIARQAAGR